MIKSECGRFIFLWPHDICYDDVDPNTLESRVNHVLPFRISLKELYSAKQIVYHFPDGSVIALKDIWREKSKIYPFEEAHKLYGPPCCDR